MSLRNTSNGKRIAVVTGAGRGIGRVITEHLLAHNYQVVAVVRKLADVEELERLFKPNLVALRCDVTEPSCETALRECLERNVDHIDLLFNNAGFSAKGKGITGLDFQELTNVISVHCYGPIRCVRACLPFLQKSDNACVANISSRFGSLEMVSTNAVPNQETTYPYRIAKAAMNMFTACLSVELEADRIRVLSIHPGQVKTSFGASDAATPPEEAAANIVGIAEGFEKSGAFVHATTGSVLPW
ncbi:MAG TPA: SDR family NAD(P)-dependent oxidoreductase [Oculatellaceae cyanobacterium]